MLKAKSGCLFQMQKNRSSSVKELTSKFMQIVKMSLNIMLHRGGSIMLEIGESVLTNNIQ